MRLIAVLLFIGIVISHGTALSTSTTAADGLQETTEVPFQETRSPVSDTPEIACPINESISETTRQTTNSGIEESKNISNNFNTSSITMPNSTDDLNGRNYNLQTNSSLLNSSTPQTQKSLDFPELKTALLRTLIEALFDPQFKGPKLCGTIGFLMERFFQNKSLLVPSPFFNYSIAGNSPYKAKRIGYYSNFSKERFIEEMTAQTELGALNREYYALIARNLRTFYTIATSKFKRNSVLRRIRDMVVSNYNFIAKHASPLKSGTTIASEFNEATSVEIRQQRSVEGNESESEEEALSKFLSAVAHWTNISIDEQNEFENQNWMSSTINNNFSLMKPTDDLDDHTNEPNTKNATRQTPLPKRNQDV